MVKCSGPAWIPLCYNLLLMAHLMRHLHTLTAQSSPHDASSGLSFPPSPSPSSTHCSLRTAPTCRSPSGASHCSFMAAPSHMHTRTVPASVPITSNRPLDVTGPMQHAVTPDSSVAVYSSRTAASGLGGEARCIDWCSGGWLPPTSHSLNVLSRDPVSR